MYIFDLLVNTCFQYTNCINKLACVYFVLIHTYNNTVLKPSPATCYLDVNNRLTNASGGVIHLNYINYRLNMMYGPIRHETNRTLAECSSANNQSFCTNYSVMYHSLHLLVVLCKLD